MEKDINQAVSSKTPFGLGQFRASNNMTQESCPKKQVKSGIISQIENE